MDAGTAFLITHKVWCCPTEVQPSQRVLRDGELLLRLFLVFSLWPFVLRLLSRALVATAEMDLVRAPPPCMVAERLRQCCSVNVSEKIIVDWDGDDETG